MFSEKFPTVYERMQVVVREDYEDGSLSSIEQQIVSEKLGARYLGSGLGGTTFRRQFVEDKVKDWAQELRGLVEVGKTDPQVAHSLLTMFLIPRWRFVMRTTPTEPEWFQELEEIMAGPLCEALFGVKGDGLLRKRLALPIRHGGLGMLIPMEMAMHEYEASQRVTAPLVEMLKLGGTTPGWKETLRSRKEADAIHRERELEYRRLRQEVWEGLSGARNRTAMEEMWRKGAGASLTVIPTHSSGCAMAPQRWRTMVWMKLGLEEAMGLPGPPPRRCQRSRPKSRLERHTWPR